MSAKERANRNEEMEGMGISEFGKKLAQDLKPIRTHGDCIEVDSIEHWESGLKWQLISACTFSQLVPWSEK